MQISRLLMLLLALAVLQGCGSGSDSSPTMHQVSASAGQGGTISPSSRTVESGQSTSFTVQADAGYIVMSVQGCAGQLNGNQYTTGPIRANCSVTASFERATYTVDTQVNGLGSIVPASLTLQSGEQASFTLNPSAGQELASVSGCGGELDGNSYRVGPLTASCTVQASFTTMLFEVTAVAGSGGSVLPASQLVPYSEQATFTLQPDEGYRIAKVKGCAGELRQGTFTTAAITAACQLDVSFEPDVYTISTEISGGGSVSPSSVVLAAGAQQIFRFVPADGYRVGAVEGCDGRFDGEQFTILSAAESCVLQVSFDPAEFVSFTDANLAGLVRQHLGLSTDAAIPAADLASLTQLYAGSAGIRRLDGLQYATGLRVLELANNQLQDVSILSTLARRQQAGAGLRQLRLDSNSLLHLPDFSAFNDLEILNLAFSKISDVSGLQELAVLHSLDVSGNDIRDLSWLSQLTLQSLTLTNNPIDSDALWALQSLPLQSLYLDNTQIRSLEPLSGFAQLRNLSITDTLVQDLSPLTQLPALRWLNSYATPVLDISPLLQSGLMQGHYLSLGGCLKVTGFSRAAGVIDALKAAGVNVQLYNWARPQEACPTDDGIEAVTVQAVLNDHGLSLDWQVDGTDTGPWRCELHLDLEDQLPRAPVAVMDNCHQYSHWHLPELKRSQLQLHFVLDTGLLQQARVHDAGTVIRSGEQGEIQLAGVDWLQAVVKTSPYLVPLREAVLRVHLVSAQGASPPSLQAFAEYQGQKTALDVQSPNLLPQTRNHGSLSASYRVQIPAAAMRPGTVFHLEADGLQPVLVAPEYAGVNAINLTLVPLQLGDTITPLPTNELVSNSLMTTWPLAKVNITRRQPFVLSQSASTNTTSTMVREMWDLQIAEGGRSYYYGYFTSSINTDQWGGRGYMPGFASVGLVPHGELDMTLSHELGHNFGIQHAPCGSAEGTDPAFPYAGGRIGSWGVPLSFNQLLSPSTYSDLMGYCSNRHVSDYNFEIAQDYLTENLTHPAIELQLSATATAAGVVETAALNTDASAWYYRFSLTGSGVAEVAQMMLLQQPGLISGDGAYHVMALYEQQPPVLLPVATLRLGHGEEAPELATVIPLQSDGQPLYYWGLYQGKQLLLEHKVPPAGEQQAAQSAIVLNEQSGEICVDAGTARFDSMHLLWRSGSEQQVLALNERAAQFCRPTDAVPAGGQWQLQLRRGGSVQLTEQIR